MRHVVITFPLVWSLFAQEKTPDVPKPASISGSVRDAKSGEPIADAIVTLTSGVRMVNGVTIQSKNRKSVPQTADSQGHYAFSDVTPGECVLSVVTEKQWFPAGTRILNVTAGQEVSYDIPVQVRGTISGKVTDGDGESLPGASVFLIGREYHAGAVRTLIKQMARANDQGEYTLVHVDTRRPFLVFADNRKSKLEAISPVPEDPKMRRQVFAPAFYPNSRDIAGAAPLTLSSGQHMEGIDVKLAKAPGFCVEATVEKTGVPGPLRFEIAMQQPSFGTGANGGMFGTNPGGIASNDGKIRICDLTPGVYTLQAMDWPAGSNLVDPPAMGISAFSIGDRDVKGVKVETVPTQSISGEVVLEGKPPDEPINGTVPVSLNPLVRAHFPGEQMSAKPSVPGTFTLASVPEGEYSFFPLSAPEGYFVKDITYSGVSVMRSTLRVGSAMGNAGLRVVVAPGAGKIEVAATDDKDKPVAGVNLVAMPAVVSSEAELAASLVRSSTDQDGKGTLYRLPPGNYHVLAVSENIDMTPELVSKLWQMRITKGSETEVKAGGTAQVTVKVSRLQ